MEHFDDVSLHLYDPDGDVSLQMTVLVREDEMVLNIPKQSDDGPYLVRGKRATHFFAGVDEVVDAEPTDLVARWSQLGDLFVGIWIQDGVESLFSFRLPKAPVKKPRAGARRKTRRNA